MYLCWMSGNKTTFAHCILSYTTHFFTRIRFRLLFGYIQKCVPSDGKNTGDANDFVWYKKRNNILHTLEKIRERQKQSFFRTHALGYNYA